MQYALIQIDNTGLGRVLNVIEAAPDFIAHIAPDWAQIEALDTLHEQGMGVGIGWGYDLARGEFIAPLATEAPDAPPNTRISVGAFFDRFGATKWAILADPSPSVQALIKDCSVRSFIDLARPDLPAALGLLVQAGHTVDPEAILSAPVREAELP